jgi:DNA topoisomerase-1
VVKKSKKKRTFYGCSNYPECNFILNTRPLPQPCPQCGSLLTAAGRGMAKCTQCEFRGKIKGTKEAEKEEEV